MKRSYKVAYGILILLAAGAGYGVYWWYGTAKEELPEIPEAVIEQAEEIAGLVMEGDLKSKARSRKRFDRLTREEKVGVLSILAGAEEGGVRLFAVQRLVQFRDLPRIRALLAGLAQGDPDPDVKEAATHSLAGRVP